MGAENWLLTLTPSKDAEAQLHSLANAIHKIKLNDEVTHTIINLKFERIPKHCDFRMLSGYFLTRKEASFEKLFKLEMTPQEKILQRLERINANSIYGTSNPPVPDGMNYLPTSL